jgi:hypothetical protein
VSYRPCAIDYYKERVGKSHNTKYAFVHLYIILYVRIICQPSKSLLSLDLKLLNCRARDGILAKVLLVYLLLVALPGTHAADHSFYIILQRDWSINSSVRCDMMHDGV